MKNCNGKKLIMGNQENFIVNSPIQTITKTNKTFNSFRYLFSFGIKSTSKYDYPQKVTQIHINSCPLILKTNPLLFWITVNIVTWLLDRLWGFKNYTIVISKLIISLEEQLDSKLTLTMKDQLKSASYIFFAYLGINGRRYWKWKEVRRSPNIHREVEFEVVT